MIQIQNIRVYSYPHKLPIQQETLFYTVISYFISFCILSLLSFTSYFTLVYKWKIYPPPYSYKYPLDQLYTYRFILIYILFPNIAYSILFHFFCQYDFHFITSTWYACCTCCAWVSTVSTGCTTSCACCDLLLNFSHKKAAPPYCLRNCNFLLL